MRNYIKGMLEEEVDGCELSLSSFLVAEVEGEVVAAFGGWIEGKNEDEMPSALLKANLINYYLPKENVLASMEKSDIVKPLQIDREEGDSSGLNVPPVAETNVPGIAETNVPAVAE